jgi:2-oxoglutarate ferredoxin oxidoreductase subunit alpha
LTEVIKSKKVKYLQAEDEIAVINSALWASYTWARSMVWTSWGWFALMSEALSFAVQAEIPVTAVLAQRAWPSTWTPTFHEAWDLNYALNPTFWDFEHIVLYPSSLEEAYFFWWWALNLADKYQSIVLLLVDKQSAELHGTVWKLEVPEIDRGKMLENPWVDYKRYELVEDWISPRVKVWTPSWDFIATSYEHDEYWATSEESAMKVLMTEKRFKKLRDFYKKENIRWFEVFYILDDSEKIITPKKFIITTSFTSYTAREFVKNNREFWLIIIKVLKPLDEELLNFIKEKDLEEIIFVENNYSWQLENYISKELWLKYIKWLKVSHLRKYDLFPFYYEDFEGLKGV